jgi:hypothetical protein
MVTIGDVFSVIAAILAICGSAWALMLTTALLFRQRTLSSQLSIEGHPWRSFLIGFALLLTVGVVALGMVGNANPGIKLLGTMLTLGLLSVAAIGGGGLAQLIGERLRHLDPSLSPYAAVVRGAGIIVVAGLLPLVGWWVFMPIVLAISLGSGVSSLFARQTAAEPSVTLQA